jgi:hypothetical protein
MSDTFEVRDDSGQVAHIDDRNQNVTYRTPEGKLVTRDLSSADVHINSALGNYAAGYKLAPAVAEIVAPVVLTEKASDYFYTWDKLDAFQSASVQIASEGDKLPEISPRVSSTLFSTVPYGLMSFVPQGIIANADTPLQPRLAAMNRIMNVMLRAREERTAAALQTAGSFTSFTSTLGATAKWNGGTASDPVADMHLAIETALMEITHIVMSERTWHAFIRNPNVAKYSLYKDGAKTLDTANPSDLSALLGLPQIVVGKMKGRSSSAGTYGYLWGNPVTFLHNPPGVPTDGQSICTAKTFRWSKGGLATDANGFRVRTWFDPYLGQDGGERIAVLTNETVVITGPATGYYLVDAYQ